METATPLNNSTFSNRVFFETRRKTIDEILFPILRSSWKARTHRGRIERQRSHVELKSTVKRLHHLGRSLGRVGVRIDWFRVEIASSLLRGNTRNFYFVRVSSPIQFSRSLYTAIPHVNCENVCCELFFNHYWNNFTPLLVPSSNLIEKYRSIEIILQNFTRIERNISYKFIEWSSSSPNSFNSLRTFMVEATSFDHRKEGEKSS